MIRITLCIPLIAGCLIARPTCAEPRDSRPVTVEEVIEFALANSPEVKAIEANQAAVRAEGIALGTLSNPQLDGEYRYPTSSAGRARANEAGASLSQPLRLSNFGARQRVNALIQSSADADRAMAVLALSQEIRLLYTKGWVLSERQLQLESTRKKAAGVSRYIEQAVGRGLFGKGEGAGFRAEERRLAAELVGVGADLERVRADLTRKTAMTFDAVAFKRPEWTEVTLPVAGGGAELPVQKRAELLTKLAEEHNRLARLDRFPRFSPRLVYARTNDGFDYAGVGLSIELPVFDANRAERTRREAEAGAARAAKTYFAGDSFASEVSHLVNAVRATSEQARMYEREVSPQFEEALRTYDERLRAGQAALPQIWQTLQALSGSRDTGLELQVKAATARAELSVMVGQDV